MHQEDAASVLAAAHGEFKRAEERGSVESVACEYFRRGEVRVECGEFFGCRGNKIDLGRQRFVERRTEADLAKPRAMAAAGISKIAEMRTRNLPLIMTPQGRSRMGRELANWV
jgi:hypothetical protein